MPSRAVLRKKARRESKRQKSADAPTPVEEKRVAVPVERSPPVTPSHAPMPPASLHRPAVPYVSRKRQREEQRAADEEEMAGLTRKERKKLEASRRLERQIGRLETASRRNAPVVEGEEGSEEESSGSAPASSAPVQRHDPRFSNGTFWRNRKERRARTLFLGGIPVSFTEGQLRDFIMTTLDSDIQGAEYLQELSSDQPVVDEVDFLPNKHMAKVRHMYITLASVPLAGCVAAKLDGYKLDSRNLRCNFAADKTQRSEAIRRRG